jgi:hypothetical protein
MLSAPITKTKTRRIAEKRSAAPPAPPLTLVLVAASYDPDGLELFLMFDRAVDISAIDLAAFGVVDGLNGRRLAASGVAAYTDPTQPVLLLSVIGDYLGADTLLNVSEGNGIVAVDDGGSWAGASGLVLPFP